MMIIISSYDDHHNKEGGMGAAECHSLRLADLFDENRVLEFLRSRVLEI